MDRILSNIMVIPGIIGVSIFKEDGTVAAYRFPEAYSYDHILEIGSNYRSLKDLLHESDGDLVYLSWEYENLLIFFYPVDGGWINIVSEVTIPMPVFSFTMSAVAKTISDVLKNSTTVEGQREEEKRYVPPEDIEKLQKIFNIFLGPASGVLFENEAKKLNFSLSNIPVSKLKHVLDKMLLKIPEEKRNETQGKLESYYG